MYIWVILATFITILYSFNLAVRPDMRQIYVEPQAEAVVTKLVVQHRGAMKYIKYNTPPLNNKNAVSYYPGEISFDDLEEYGYLPYGFQPGGYTTLMYCLKKSSSGLSQQISASCPGNQPSCCSNTDSINYLVMFGCVPNRWRDIKTGLPNTDLLNAMQNVVGSGIDFGYTETVKASTNKLGSTMVIRGRQANQEQGNSGSSETYGVAVPKYIVSGSLAGASRTVANTCGKANCKYCLMYMSPFE